MHFTHGLSVKAKLVLAIIGTAFVSLILACGLFIVFEMKVFRQSLVIRMTTVADVLALNSAVALEFDDREKANEVLGGVAANPGIVTAGVYTMDGKLFASFPLSGAAVDLPSEPDKSDSRFTEGHLFLFRPVVRDGQQIGSIGLVASSEELRERLVSYGIISASVLGGCLAFAAVLGYFLQRKISKPIANLATTAQTISEGKDYSARAIVETGDEMGQLAVSFNEMLAGIEERDRTLVGANEELKTQVRAREQAEQKLKTLNEELERRVEKRTRELKRSNEELEQFAYVASHDLKEPVRMVISYLQLIEKRYMDMLDEQGRQFLHFAVDGGHRMQALIMDLLTYSRVGSEKKPFQQVDLGAVLDAVITDLHLAIKESGATITHDTMPVVTGDPAQLGRVLQNLIANSIKFHGVEPPKIHVSALREGQDWKIGVSDNGIGIEPQYFQRIFVIFQRLHGRTEYPGTGIGLAVCKRIVERHGGRIWVESEPGKGTTFYFTIGDSFADGI